jgi:hypothetical protein
MTRCIAALSITFVGLIFVTGAVDSGDKEKKDDKKFKGMLPDGWKALKLEKDQVTKIYAVQKTFKGKIRDLEDQITALKAMERAEMVKVLTEEQKSLLRKLSTGEDFKEKSIEAPKEKKVDEVKDKKVEKEKATEK